MDLIKKSLRLFVLLSLLLAACDSDPLVSSRTIELTGAPGTPAGLSASCGSYSNRIVLSWDKASDATGYTVWRMDSGEFGGIASGTSSDDIYSQLQAQGFTLVTATSSTSYTDWVSGGYVYTVVAYRDLSTDPVGTLSSGSLYSSCSDYAEGLALSSSDSLTVTGAEEEDGICLYFDVLDLYSVLEPGEALCSYSFSVDYRKTTESSWTAGVSATEDNSWVLESYDSGEEYQFKVTLTLPSGNLVNDSCVVSTEDAE